MKRSLGDTIVWMLRMRNEAMTTLEMLDAWELQHFWFLSLRLYSVLRELEAEGAVKKLTIKTFASERGGRPKYAYTVSP